MTIPVLQVENLVKRYGDVEAVRGVSFTVEEGEVFGLLGPNGAGKTTTVEILEGLRDADSGRVRVCGFDPQGNADQLKHEIGAALQSISLPDKLRVMEALWADLSQEEDRFESPAWHAQALREAECAMKNGKAKFSDWETAKKRIRRKAAKLA